MYNEVNKREFLSGLAGEKNGYIADYFKKVSSEEERLGKDICEFTTSELLSFYKLIGTDSFLTLRNMNSSFIRYIQWCISNDMTLDKHNHASDINKEALLDCINVARKNSRFITRERLLDDISYLYNPKDQFIVLALFEGVISTDYHELSDLYAENIHEKTIEVNGKEIPVSKELIMYASQSADTYEMYKFNKKAGAYSDIPTDAYDRSDNHIVKVTYNVKNPESYTRRCRVTMATIKEALQCEAYSAKALYESGRIDFIKNLYKEKGNGVPMGVFIREHREEVIERYGEFTIDGYYESYQKYLES